MKPLRPSKKWVLVAIGLLLALLSLKIVLFLTAKPKIKVDYVAEYNRITRPTNCDSNDNAAPHYQQALDTFIQMPENLRVPFVDWPTDYNDVYQRMLKEWLASNSQSFEYFRIAAHRPYYWLERQASEDNNMFSIMTPELAPLRQLIEAVIWEAKLDVCKGQFQDAFEKILDCYRAGLQKCRTPSFLMEQLVGTSFKKMAVSNALIIIDRTSIDSATLQLFQNALETEFYSDKHVPDIATEKLMFYDAIQRVFVDNGRGTGRLAWRAAYAFDVMCCEWTNIKMRLNCFVGPTRNETLQKIEKYFELCETLWTLTSWELRNKYPNYFTKIESLEKSNFLLDILTISPQGISRPYYRTRSQTQALITILAIIRFRADNNQLPNTLDELVSSGYLRYIPMDPYSNGPLVYRLTKNNFTLYSVGEDFSDNGGVAKAGHVLMSQQLGMTSYTEQSDIVYWPVLRIERLQRQKSEGNYRQLDDI